jgi:hypothetical protein
MADMNTTTIPPNVCPKCKPSVATALASERASPDAETGDKESTSSGASPPHCDWDNGLITPLEEALEEERTRLMLANSVLGCLQTALDPEAVTVTPPAYFPEVLELAREFINKSVRHLEYEEIRRLMHCSTSSKQGRRSP